VDSKSHNLDTGVDSANEETEIRNKRMEDITHNLLQLCVLVYRLRDDPTTDATSGRQSMENIRQCAQYAHRTISVASTTIHARSMTPASGFGDFFGGDFDGPVLKWLARFESVPESVTSIDESRMTATDASIAVRTTLSDESANTTGELTASPVVNDSSPESIDIRPIGPIFSNPRGEATSPESASRRGTPQRRIENLLKIAVEDFNTHLYKQAQLAFETAMKECGQNYPHGYVWDDSLLSMMANCYPKTENVKPLQEINLPIRIDAMAGLFMDKLMIALYEAKCSSALESILGMDFESYLKLWVMKGLVLRYTVEYGPRVNAINVLSNLLTARTRRGMSTDDVLHCLANVYYHKRDYDQALQHCKRAMEERERINEARGCRELDRFLLHRSEYLCYLILMGRRDKLEARVLVEEMPKDVRQGTCHPYCFLPRMF
jgi:hypothetical protein